MKKRLLAPVLILAVIFAIIFLIVVNSYAHKLYIDEVNGEISNDKIKVEIDRATATFKVTDKKTGLVWEQAASEDEFEVTELRKSGNELLVSLEGKMNLEMSMTIRPNSDLVITMNVENNDAPFAGLKFPGPFKNHSSEYSLVLPEAEGILVPVGDSTFKWGQGIREIYGMSGLIMPWVGVTDRDFQKGYMMIIDTPDDCAINIADESKLRMPSVIWKPVKKTFGYPRKLIYHFFSHGGYVAQCKKYRDYVIESGNFKSFREKAKVNPNIDKLIGAVHIYAWDTGRKLEIMMDMKKAGIKKAWIGWDPSHPPYPAPGFDEGIKKLGYLSGVYDLYKGAFNYDYIEPLLENDPVYKELIFHRYYFPGLIPDAVRKAENGDLIGLTIPGKFTRYDLCSLALIPHIGDRITRELEIYPHDSIFLDVLTANVFSECFDPVHPTNNSDDRAARKKIHKYFSDDLKMVIGAEYGADFVLPYLDFTHGSMTQHNFGLFGSGLGDWSDVARPSIMLMEVEPSDDYLNYGLGTSYRVPLYSLVYHDSIVSSWRWEDYNNKMPSVWDKKDLWNILYGSAPLWNFDEDLWNKYRERFAESYKIIGPWLEKIGYDEMIDHKFLKNDRTVQQTVFSSGWQVIVNFGEKEYVSGNIRVEPNSFKIMKGSKK